MDVFRSMPLIITFTEQELYMAVFAVIATLLSGVLLYRNRFLYHEKTRMVPRLIITAIIAGAVLSLPLSLLTWPILPHFYLVGDNESIVKGVVDGNFRSECRRLYVTNASSAPFFINEDCTVRKDSSRMYIRHQSELMPYSSLSKFRNYTIDMDKDIDSRTDDSLYQFRKMIDDADQSHSWLTEIRPGESAEVTEFPNSVTTRY